MYLPFDTPIMVSFILIFLFFVLGSLFQTFSLRNFHLSLHNYLLDYSVAFMFTGTTLQYTFISFFYGNIYAQILSALEFMVIHEISKGGSGNPLDNVLIPVIKNWHRFARIPFQVFGSFTATFVSLAFWNMKYGERAKTILTTTKDEGGQTIDQYMCRIPLSISPHDGFLFEFLGSIVRIVISKWNTSANKWTNKLMRLACRICLKLQGSYTTNYVVNPLCIVNYYVFCPKEINIVFFTVYCVAPTLGSLFTFSLGILPEKRIRRVKSVQTIKRGILKKTYQQRIQCTQNRNK